MNNKFFMLLLIAGMAACNNADVDAVPKSMPENAFFDYQIWAEEDSDDATIRLQYKLDDEQGSAIALPAGEKVLLDDTHFQLDSTKYGGVYYELTKPLEEMQGRHIIHVVDEDGKEHLETFTFTPFELLEELPEEIPQQRFQLGFKNFPSSPTRIQLVMVDTSLESAGVNENILVENGVLNISEEMLSGLKKGPVSMEISRLEERPIGSGSKFRGKLLIHYSIRRQFQLVE